jgi:hypothetical protein
MSIRMDSEVQTLVRRAQEVWAVTHAECERAREVIRAIAFELPAGDSRYLRSFMVLSK